MGGFPFVGEIRLFSYNFAPPDWLICDGASVSRTEYADLFAVIGIIYGSEDNNHFNLPNLAGRTAMHAAGAPLPIGLQGGAVQCALEMGEMPGHTHPVWAYHNAPILPNPGDNAWTTASEPAYSATAGGYMALNSIQSSGKGLAHENQQPYLVMNYCICCHGLSF